MILGGGRRSFVPILTTDSEEPEKEGRRLDGRNLIDEWIRNRRGLAARYVSSKAQLENIDPRTTDHLLGRYTKTMLHALFAAYTQNITKAELVKFFTVHFLNKTHSNYYRLVCLLAHGFSCGS